MNVLYVEDNLDDSALVMGELRKRAPHIHLDHVETFAEALARLEPTHNYEVVLTDMRLPDGDGLALLSHVRGRALPLAVVLVTGAGDEETAVAVLKAGADDYVVKRRDYSARLPITLENALHHHQAELARRMRPLLVLYAEHNTADIDLTRRHMAAHAPHIHLEAVRTCEEILQLVPSGGSTGPYDVLLLDYRLPGMNALEIVKELRSARGLDVPIVLVTGGGDEEIALQALKLGASDYVPKNAGYLNRLPGVLENAFSQASLVRERTALRGSEARFRATFEQAAVGIAHVAPDGRWLRVNNRLCEIVGYAREELLERTFQDITHPDDLDLDLNYVSRVLAGEIQTYSMEKRYIRKDGTHVWIDLTVSLVRETSGEPNYFIGVVEDITGRKLAQEALRAAEERYRSLFERNLAGVFRFTLDGRILECNQAFARIYGYESVEEIKQRHATDLYVEPGAREAFLSALKEQGGLTNFEERGRRKDGQPIVVIETVGLVESAPGQPPHIEGTLIEITERRNLEEQLRQSQKMEAIGRLAGGIAHDFNNLLTAILGYSSLLASQFPADHPLYEEIEEIRKAGERAAALTRQLLAFSRKQILLPKILSLNEVVSNLDKMLRRVIGEDVDLALELDPGLAHVKADPGQIEQVIMNLAVNARDAMPHGGRLKIETRNLEVDGESAVKYPELPPGSYAVLAVADTGVGMDAETRSRIFEPFFTTKEMGHGTGLGLSTVYGIVKQSDGHVWVESEPGKGATFKICLPRVEVEVEKQDGGAAGAESLRGTETILLVEDEAGVLQLTHNLLSRRGYSVLAAPSADVALELIAQHPGRIDLILSDVVLPGTSGPDLAARVSSLRPGIRVLYMSGYADHALLRDGSIAIEELFLQKPFTPTALARKIREVLDGSR